MTITETIKDIAELWRLRSVFDDKQQLLQVALEQLRITQSQDGTIVGHFPRWTAVIHKDGYGCTCPDHQYRGSQCKHLGAVATQVTKNWSEEFQQSNGDNNETN